MITAIFKNVYEKFSNTKKEKIIPKNVDTIKNIENDTFSSKGIFTSRFALITGLPQIGNLIVYKKVYRNRMQSTILYPEQEEVKEEPCYCEYEDGTKEVVACPEDGSEPICPDKNPPPPEVKEYIPTMYEKPYDDFYPEWRTQDINMARTIRGERHNKYGPYFSVPRAPEMQPVYKNWLGRVQSELANVAGNTLALQRSGPKNRALLTQIDNKPQEAIERTNTENVGIQNQAILQNLTAQEKNYFNLDKAKQRYQGESSFANQSYDNEINDWNFRKTLQQNLGLTNAANTYNEQTEQFAINPRTGVQIFKDGRLNRPTRDSSLLNQLAEAKASGLYPGIDDKTLLAAITSDRLNRSQYGGPLYAMGGYVYGNMTYPFDY